MTKGEKTYYDIQEVGKRNIEEIAATIIRNLNPILGRVYFPKDLSSINKLYFLLESGCYPWIKKELQKYGYSSEVEIQHLIRNVTYLESQYGYDSIKCAISKFPAFKCLYRGVYEYQMDTSIGLITFTPLTRYIKDNRIRRFALTKDTNHYCHAASLEFIQANPEYVAITSLVNNQFGERQYHSYVETPDGYADFSNNAYLSKQDFEKVMEPQILNKVAGYELAQKEAELTSEDLPADKTLLLRLAVHNQIKNG